MNPCDSLIFFFSGGIYNYKAKLYEKQGSGEGKTPTAASTSHSNYMKMEFLN